MSQLKGRFLVRSDNTTNWSKAEAKILKLGEIGYDTEKKIFKIGDGVTSWTNIKQYYTRTFTITATEYNALGTNILDTDIYIVTNDAKTALSGIYAGSTKIFTPYTHPGSGRNKSSGLYKITTDAQGHVTAATAVTKADITALGIPGQDTNTTYGTFKAATTSAAGGNGLVPAPDAGNANRYLRSDGTWSVPPDNNTVYTHPGYTSRTSGLYKITVDSTGHVNNATAVTKSDITALGIPGQDTNTTYSLATSSNLGLVKLATGTGSATDTTMTQKAITDNLNGKASSSHNHDSTYSKTNHTHTSLVITSQISADTDWNTLSPGTYTVSQSTAFVADKNQPVGAYTYGLLLVFDGTGLQITQIYIAHQRGHIYYRQRFSGANFYSWKKFYTEESKPTPSEIGAATSAQGAKADNAMPRSGGTFTGNVSFNGVINSAKVTNTWLEGNRGNAIINSTSSAGSYTMLAKMNSNNGYFTHGTYQDKYYFNYTAKTTVDAGTNATTKQIILLNESGNSTFPGKVSASSFAGSLSGNASTATTLQNARTITIGNTGKSFNGSANVTWTLGEIGAAASSHTHTELVTKGAVTMETERKVSGTGIFATEAYNNGYPSRYGNILNIVGKSKAGAGQLLLGWTGAGGPTGDILYRSLRDTEDHWTDWVKILTSANYSNYTVGKTGYGASGTWGINISGKASTAGVADSANSVTWANVSSKPSTFTPSAHNQAISTITGIQTLSIQLNGGTAQTYTPSKALSLNITPASIGAATSGHTHSTGSDTVLGLTKLYTSTGSGTDGTMTRTAITSALNGKSSTTHNHNTSYVQLSTANVMSTTSSIAIGKYYAPDVSGATNVLYLNKDGINLQDTIGNRKVEIKIQGSTGQITAGKFIGALQGNASTATTLQNARTINGTSFNGNGNITTSYWGTSRTIRIGNTSKSVNGSANVTWTLGEIGAAASSHTHTNLSNGDMLVNCSTDSVYIGALKNKGYTVIVNDMIGESDTDKLGDGNENWNISIDGSAHFSHISADEIYVGTRKVYDNSRIKSAATLPSSTSLPIGDILCIYE